VLKWEGGEVGTDAAEAGPVASALRQSLLDIQYGRAEDVHGWIRRLV
jgi:branched-chain amino acid aminotransferase